MVINVFLNLTSLQMQHHYLKRKKKKDWRSNRSKIVLKCLPTPSVLDPIIKTLFRDLLCLFWPRRWSTRAFVDPLCKNWESLPFVTASLYGKFISNARQDFYIRSNKMPPASRQEKPLQDTSDRFLFERTSPIQLTINVFG